MDGNDSCSNKGFTKKLFENLGMGRDDFYTLSKVEQMRIKQDVGLF